MKSYLTDINALFPVRNSPDQKKAFREYLRKDFPAAREETLDGHTNIIIGDPDKAQIVYCAHYDTPRRSLFPNLMLPVSKPLHYLYSFGILLPFLIIALLFGLAAGQLSSSGGKVMPERAPIVLGFLLAYYSLYFLCFRGPANKHNANDNTSGIAAVLTLAARYTGNDKAAFILFDDEEKGKKGSKAYARAHAHVKTSVPVINMDCIGNGSDLIISASEGFAACSLFPAFENALKVSQMPSHIYTGKKASLNSDHRNFDCSAGICACKRSQRGTFYTPLIHTARDTVADEKNILLLTEALSAMTEKL